MHNAAANDLAAYLRRHLLCPQKYILTPCPPSRSKNSRHAKPDTARCTALHRRAPFHCLLSNSARTSSLPSGFSAMLLPPKAKTDTPPALQPLRTAPPHARFLPPQCSKARFQPLHRIAAQHQKQVFAVVIVKSFLQLFQHCFVIPVSSPFLFGKKPYQSGTACQNRIKSVAKALCGAAVDLCSPPRRSRPRAPSGGR